MESTISHFPQGPGTEMSEQELIGTRIGNIRIVSLLARGGMGAVLSGVDEKLERWVALKVIHRDRRMDAEVKARFLREARVLSKLEHPHICQIYDYLEGGERGDFLVLELIRGKTLDRVIRDGLDEASRLRIALQLADALVAAHGQSVVHRDLKPRNVMLSESGQVKVLDFGLSRFADEERSLTLAPMAADASQPGSDMAAEEYLETQLGSVLGTPSYMSPEQARGEPASPASDMFSFGLLLQELFTGDPAYEPSDGFAEKLAKVRSARTRPLSGVDSDLAALIERLKSLSPGARPSAQDTAERLLYLSNKPRRRLKRLAVGAAMLLLAIIAAVMAMQSVRIARERDRAEAALARAESETAKARAINEFVQQALGSADPYEGVGREVTLLDTLAGVVEKIDESLADQPGVAAAVRVTFGTTYSSLGRYEEASELLEAALETRLRLYGPGYGDVAESQHLLGILRWRQGRLDEAESLLRTALTTQCELHGEAHSGALEVMMDLGIVLEHKDDLDEAERIDRRVLELTRTTYGDEHPHIAKVLNDLAWVVFRQGKLDEAESLFRQCLELRRRTLAANHPFIALTQNNLAIVLSQQGELDEAESLYRSALEIRRQVLGEDHPRFAQSLMGLANLLQSRGATAEAEELLHRAVAIKRKTLAGEVDNDLAVGLDRLGSMLSDRGDLDAAEQYYREAVDTYRRLGDDARPTYSATTLQNLAWLLTKKGDPDAERLYLDALEIMEETCDPEHWMIANTRANLGSLLTRLGRFQEAEELLLQSQPVLLATFGEDHPRSEKVRRFLAELYEAWGRPAPASGAGTPGELAR